ncbi:MAG: GAF domain-containing protein [Melioribacteraceae bacterium]|nr:GAF domain-containing protein [Melioribacteraceae bacterium]
MKEIKPKSTSYKNENELLKKQLAQKEAELAIISSVSEAISKQLDIETITRIIGDKVRDIFNSEVTEILLLDDLTNMIQVPYSFYREYQIAEPFHLGEGLTSRIIKSGKPLVLGTFEESLKLGVLVQSEEEKTETYIGVPIIVSNKVIGVVSIQSYKKNDYNDEKVRLLSILSSNMGIALQNAKLFDETKRLLKETEQRSAELTIINSVGEAMSKQLDVTTVTKIVGDKVKEIFNAEVTEILLLDQETHLISVPYSYYNGYQSVEPFYLGEGLTSKVIDSRKPLLLLNAEDQNKLGAITDENVGEADITETYLGVPILFNDRILGVVSIQSYEKNAYDENDVRLLSTLSANMGVTLQNAKLFEETKRLLSETEQRTAELAIINSVQEGLATKLEMQAIYDLVGDKIRDIFDAQVVDIGLFNRDTNILNFPYTIERGVRFPDEPMQIIGFRKYVIDTKQPLLIGSNNEEVSRKYGNPMAIQGEAAKSILYVPMLVNGEARGVISLQNLDHENAFSESDVSLLTTLASAMSVALENARLFDETSRLLKETEQRTAELAVINSVQEGLAKELDIHGIYELVGEKIRKIFNAQVIDIVTYDRTTNTIQDKYSYEKGDRTLLGIREPNGFRKQLIDTKRVFLVNEDFSKLAKKYNNPTQIGEVPKSAVFVPMLVGEEVKGIISLQNLDVENAFSKSDVRLLTTLSNSMSVALENARLFDETNRLLKETEQRTAELSVINSVQEGLAKELDIHGIYELVGEKIREIFNAQVIDIVTYDKQNNLIEDKYAFEKGDRTLLAPRAPHGFRKHLIETKQLLLINEDVERMGVEFNNPAQIGEEPKAAVFVPMLVGDEVKGIISLQNLDRENAFSDSDVRLLTTLANSMSVALENARLFDETNRLLKETEQRTAELAVINSVQEGLAKELDIHGIYNLVGDRLCSLFPDSQTLVIRTFDHDTGLELWQYAIEKGIRLEVEPRPFNWANKQLIQSKQSLFINQNYVETAKKYGGTGVTKGQPPKSAVFVPMIVGDIVKGSISLQNVDRENAFTESDLRLLTTLTNSMSVALENARLFDETNKLLEETKQQAIELGIINSVGEGLAKQLDFQSIVDLVGDKIREVFNAQVVSISTYNSSADTIHHRYVVEKDERFFFDKPISIDSDRKEIVEKKRPLIFGTSQEIIDHSGDAVLAGDMPESFMGVPIIHNQKVTGVITVQDLDRQNLYSEQDVQLLLTLASNMGVALENARLFEETNRLLNETQQRNTELSILNTIQEGLVTEMEFESIITLVGDKFREALGFQDLGIRLYDKEKNILHFHFEYEHGEQLFIESMEPTPLSKYVLDSGKMLLLKKNTPEEKTKLGIKGKTTIPGTDVSKSLIIVPILLGSETKGLIIIENYEKEDAFTESDIRLLTTVANSMSVALENARLFKETLRLLDESKKRTAELGTVNSISQAIAGHLEINKLISLVGDKVRDLFNANIVYLALLDKEREMIEFPYGYGEEFPPLKLGSGLTSRIILNKEPLLINKEVNRKTEELGIKRIGTPSASYVGVPIPVGEEIIGVLSVQSTENENVFTESDMRLLSTIAAHVGIAINNANQYEELNITLEDLRSTQNQLIAQEKLASLGQLTAGIAHEIKNPLNFVNNFSELSVGLVEELKEELGKLNSSLNKEVLVEVTDILNTLKQNSEKIKEHGKRADSIVHSMLQHSRGKTGEKQLTDINAMLDEDLNLVYHGMRAQDSTFNIQIEKEYDKSMSHINVIPQDISRVFLNILTNGCYEAHRKKTELKTEELAKIKVKTSETDKFVEVRIRDNGNGIPEKIRDDLFTPFFTTKPSGKGTGLGLSISYDIVVSEHQGELLFETVEGEFTEFIIRLPKNIKSR